MDNQPPTPLKDAINKLGTTQGLELDARHDATHDDVSLWATKDFGKGWSGSGAVQWAKDAGYAVLGRLKWSPK